MNEKANDQATVEKLEAVWRSIDDLCAGLSEDDWERDTECPGWSVKDNISHIIGTESRLAGRPTPEHQVPDGLSHVHNPIGQSNEVEVDYRRGWPAEKVLEEYREITSSRLKELRSWGPDDFSKESWTPMGQGTVRDFLEIRILDCWVHEQDIRRAVGQSGHLSGPAAEHAFGRIASAMPFVVGKKVSPPDGTVVVFDITGDAGGRFAVGVEGGRAKLVDPVPDECAVTLTMDLETFNCLGCGRWDAEKALGSERVQISGDEDLGRRIVEQMNFMI